MLHPSVATTGRKISTESTPDMQIPCMGSKQSEDPSPKVQPTKIEETPQKLVITATTRNHTWWYPIIEG